jgi:hypothetical protein
MGKAPQFSCAPVSDINGLSVPSGQWPDGTGGSPVLPIPVSEFGFNAKSASLSFAPLRALRATLKLFFSREDREVREGKTSKDF